LCENETCEAQALRLLNARLGVPELEIVVTLEAEYDMEEARDEALASVLVGTTF